MQEGKTYALRLDVRSVSAEELTQGNSYAIKVTIGKYQAMQILRKERQDQSR
jgi:hypothetical protein